jgi:magnesium chelatase family protein
VATVIKTIGITGISGYAIDVQAKTLAGLSTVNIIGLGDQAVKESRDRIESAFDQLNCKFPSEKIVINLAPSEVKKSGTSFDLAMLVALLIESGELEIAQSTSLKETVFLGELGLTGELFHFSGALPMVAYAAKKGYERVILPKDSLNEASMVTGIELTAFEHVEEVVLWLQGKLKITALQPKPEKKTCEDIQSLDFSDVIGHENMMKYVIAAAAGNHNLIMIGPPGCGKSMIAKRIAGILPELSEKEKLELLSIQSIAGLLKSGKTSNTRPFRSPHYNTSSSAIVGGGVNAMPGEISLAHHGILFLDELPEFPPKVIDSLRQPLEDGIVTVTRVKQTNVFPAQFMLVAAMNPCKCGYFGTPKCVCRPSDVRRYRNRISGPIYDRLDIQKYMNKVNIFTEDKGISNYSSKEMRALVKAARSIQEKRFKDDLEIYANGQMQMRHIKVHCVLEKDAQIAFRKFNDSYEFSARSYSKIMCVARTFADLEGASKIRKDDLLSAIMGRDLERESGQL